MKSSMKKLLSYLLLSCGLCAQAEDASKLYRIGMAALQANDFEIAEKNFSRSAELAPSFSLVRLHLAIVQNKLGHIGDAQENVTTALRLGLDGPARETAEQLQAELEYKSQKKGKVATDIVALLDGLQSRASVEKSDGSSCSSERNYSAPVISGCFLSYSYRQVASDGCQLTGGARQYRYKIPLNLSTIEVAEIAGQMDQSPKTFHEVGVTAVKIHLDTPVDCEIESGKYGSCSEREFLIAYPNSQTATRMRDLLESYSQVCLASKEEEESRATQGAQIASALLNRKTARDVDYLRRFSGNWSWRESSTKHRGDFDECSLFESRSEHVQLSELDEEKGELRGTAKYSHNRSIYSAGVLFRKCRETLSDSSIESEHVEESNWVARVTDENEVTLQVLLTGCTGVDCNAKSGEKYEYKILLQKDGSLLKQSAMSYRSFERQE